MVDEIIWEKDYNPEKSSTWSSDGRYEYVHKKYYKKCYFSRNGKKELTGHKYLDSESEEKIDHYDYSYEDSKEEKTGNYISHHNYKYFILKAWNWDNNYYNEYEYKRYKRRVIVLDTGKKIYGDWWFDEKYYK